MPMSTVMTDGMCGWDRALIRSILTSRSGVGASAAEHTTLGLCMLKVSKLCKDTKAARRTFSGEHSKYCLHPSAALATRGDSPRDLHASAFGTSDR
jgi:hypothetical protein